ncbi:MAG: YcjF family protein [Cyanobacteriota bacterium]|jgi:uncharacterized protein (DUF697 family)
MNSPEISTKASESIKRHMIAGAVAGALPFPWVGLASLAAIQLNMLRHLASIYNTTFSDEVGKSAIAALVGTDFSIGFSSSLARLVPGPTGAIASVAGGVMGAASTFALGKIFVQHFESGNTFLTFDPEKVRAHYQQLYKMGVADSPSSFAGIRP